MTPYYSDEWLTVHQGDCREVMASMEPASVHCVVTSPPYWGLRDYGTATWVGGDEACDHVRPNARKAHERRASTLGGGVATVAAQDAGVNAEATCGRCGAQREDGQLGLEPTPEAYVASMVAVFREVRRVLRDDGTVWLNLGDSYAQSGKGGGGSFEAERPGYLPGVRGRPLRQLPGSQAADGVLKPKDLVGIPWMVAFALRADGWYLRSDIIWSKPNPMPESVTDRPTKSHEYLFLLSKKPTYYFDADAVREPHVAEDRRGDNRVPYLTKTSGQPHAPSGGAGYLGQTPSGRNIRSVWTVGYNDVEWIGAIGSCQRCGGLRVAGNGSAPTTSRDTDGSAPPTDSGPTNSAPTACPTSSLWDPSQSASPSTISAETRDASTPPTSSPSRHGLTSSEATRSQPGTPLRPGASTGTTSTQRTLTDALTAGGSAVCVCVTEPGGGGLPDVWQVATQPYPGAHFATFPEKLIEPCIKAGSPQMGTVLDPFAGSGTTGRVAQRLGRRAVLIDLNADYLVQAMRRNQDIPLGLETA